MQYLDYVGLTKVWEEMHPHVSFYGVCTTLGSVQAKVVNVSGLRDIVAGTRVLIRFENENSATTPTLEINSNGLDNSKRAAYPIIDDNGNTLTYVSASKISNMCEFVYDGDGHWVLLSNKPVNQIIYTDGSDEPVGEPGMIWLKKKT